MIPYRIIEAKRNGEALEPPDLKRFFLRYMEGDVHEYQMAAFLMAVYFQGLAPAELDAVVDVMIESGESLDLAWLGGPRVDKHSTGGVGDKVSLALAPLAAELGMYVPMMSGRGLGHTGGTLDKLEAIPGFRTDLTLDAFRDVLERVGCAMIGQTREIAPLDKRLYDLRSVTGTVPAIPLIAASIMSKKLSEGLSGLVLDVKVGEGAFIPGEEKALELARTMVGIGAGRGVPTRALMTAMDRPLGRAVGNALETAEAMECLSGAGPEDLRRLVVALAGEMAALAEQVPSPEEGRRRAETALDDGRARERWLRMVEAQGGDPASLETTGGLPRAPETRVLEADRDGWIGGVVPTVLGWGVVELGGGRRSLGDAIDPAVGFVLDVRPGMRVARGDPVGRVHARDSAGAETGLAVLRRACRVQDEPPGPERPLVSHVVSPGRVVPA